jgi:transcriptional regulator with XRE-family HTH domain
MRNRIVQFITSEGISPAKFADEIGVQRSGVSHIIAGRNNPSFDVIQKILNRYKDLNAEWLIMGIGKMYKSEQHQTQPIEDKKIINRTKAEPDLFNSQPVNNMANTVKVASNTDIELKTTSEPKIEKIVIFYSDQTFSEYKPK